MESERPNDEGPKTVLHALREQARQRGGSPALWTKRSGSYQPTSWRGYLQSVQRCALGLSTLGVQSKDAIAILSFNREEWIVADLGAMALGAVAAGIYTNSSPEQIQYVAQHCEVKVLVVENARYLGTVQSLRAQLPALKQVVVMEPPESLPEDVITFAQLLELGAAQDPARFDAHLDALDPAALATLIYTSGTTGNPKGVMLSHRNLAWTASQLVHAVELSPREILLSYLPLSHIAEQLASIHGPLLYGIEVFFAESFDTLGANLREVRPTVFFGVPRVWEKFKAKAEEAIRAQPAAKQKLLQTSMKLALKRNLIALDRQRVPLTLELAFQAARRFVFGPLKEKIGLDRARILVTSAAPIGRDVLDFFASMDLVVREVYGQSEVTGPTSVNTEHFTRLGTLGRPMSGVEVRIAEDGEILVHGENVCLGYYKEPAATAELLEDGWLHSGDVGALDEDGFLRITGRKKEIIVTSGGKKTAPSNIELLLKAVAPLGNAMVVGERRNYLVALLSLDPEQVPAFARAKGLPADPKSLAEDPRFLDYLSRTFDAEVNPRLSRFETIKKFAVVPHDFTVEGGELTPSLKVRRKPVEQKYAALIEALYNAPQTAKSA
jgi:long-chain acyl-CoA synthetase